MRGNWEPWFQGRPGSPAAARPTRELLSPRLLFQDQIAFRVGPSKEVGMQVVRPRHGLRGLEGPSYPRPAERAGVLPMRVRLSSELPGIRDPEQFKGPVRPHHRRGCQGEPNSLNNSKV